MILIELLRAKPAQIKAGVLSLLLSITFLSACSQREGTEIGSRSLEHASDTETPGMRWLYVDSSNSAEVARKAAQIEKIDRFWSLFKTEGVGKFYGFWNKDAMLNWMSENLSKVHPQLSWEATKSDGRLRFRQRFLIVQCPFLAAVNPHTHLSS